MADFLEANLGGALLNGAQLRDANFLRARLPGAYFKGAELSGAYFRAAQLQRADFRSARLQDADFRSAQLQGANFSGVDLTQTRGLSQEQLDSAICDEGTTPPPGLTITARLGGAEV
jgi:uncharacterized protein YjbI with pentapeptide repeats